MIIEDVWGREVLDSRGNPTVEVEVVLADGYGKSHCTIGGVNRKIRSR